MVGRTHNTRSMSQFSIQITVHPSFLFTVALLVVVKCVGVTNFRRRL